MRRVHRKAVQHFGLGVIDLVKLRGLSAYVLPQSSSRMKPLPYSTFFHISQHHAGFAVVHVLTMVVTMATPCFPASVSRALTKFLAPGSTG